MKTPTIDMWLQWLGATLIAAVTLTAFAYSEFETEDRASDRIKSLENRLDRIEDKLDRLIEGR